MLPLRASSRSDSPRVPGRTPSRCGPGSKLRRLLLPRRVPLGFPILGRPVRGAAPFRLLALRLGSSGRRGASGDGSLCRVRGGSGGRLILARRRCGPRGAVRPVGATGGRERRTRGGADRRRRCGGGGGGGGGVAGGGPCG